MSYIASITKQSGGETSSETKKTFSEQNEAYNKIKEPDHHQSSIEMSENVAYSTVEQHPHFITPPIYETIN